MTMAMPDGGRPISALRRFAQRAAEAAELCELCGEPIPRGHRHLLAVTTREMQCVCYPCSVLFDQEVASNGKYRLVPERRLYLADFQITDAQWQALRIPVGMAFFFYSTPADQFVAYYPSPMGPTEAHLPLDTWDALLANNPTLRSMRRDVEALLVDRARGAQHHFLVPIDECYRLIGLMRSHWRGLSGGREVWTEMERFFDALRERSKSITLATEVTGERP